MNTKLWLDSYFDWLRNQYKITSLDDGDEISTPFTNFIGDNIRIYTFMVGSNITITDDGNTLNDLDMMGIDMDSKSRQSIITDVLNQYQVKLDDSVLCVTGKVSEFAPMKQRLLQSILRIGDLVQTRRGIVSNIFKEEVSQFLYDNDIQNFSEYTINGGTGNSYVFDFAIAGSKTKPLKLVQTMNRPTFERVAVESLTFDDIKSVPQKNKTKIESIIIYNDAENKLPTKAKNVATRYGTQLVPWSKTEKSLFV